MGISPELLEKLKAITPPVVNMSSLRKYLMDKCPFYSSALQTITIEVINDVEKLKAGAIAYTNGYRIFICPAMYEFVKQESEKVKKPWFANPEVGFAFIILHELGHIVFDSFGRLGMRSPELWNKATDYQINQFVVRLMKEARIFSSDSYTKCLDVVMKNFLLDPAKYESMTSEMTYDDLYKIGMGKGKGKGKGDGDPLAGDMIEDDESKMSDQDRMTRDIVKNEMKDYVSKNADKINGDGTCFGREFAFVKDPPKVKLSTILKNIPKVGAKEDWGWASRGGRLDHLLPPRTRMPSLVDTDPTKVDRIALIIDVSGSIDSETLNKFINVAKEALKHSKNPVHVFLHTSELVWHANIKDCNEIPTTYSGGTCFKTTIDQIARVKKDSNYRFNTVIWLTDYYGGLNPTVQDLKPILSNPNKEMKWLIYGSKEVPATGAYWHVDEIY